MIIVKDIIFEYYGMRALNQASCHIEKGTTTALVGANGAGKTTLMRCITGLEDPLNGEIRVDGIDVSESPRQVHQLMGFLSDSFGLYKQLRVDQALEYAATSRNITGNDVGKAIQQVCERLNLGDQLSRTCGELSRGWRQRIGIAQAIIHNPKVLLLDEPASGLDPEARIILAELLKQLNREGMTILVSSHILSELDQYSTHMIAMRAGKVIEQRSLIRAAKSADGGEHSTTRLMIALCKHNDDVVTWLKEQIGVVGESIRIDNQSQHAMLIHFSFKGEYNNQALLLVALAKAGYDCYRFSEVKENLQDSYLASIAALSASSQSKVNTQERR